ncbi:hypothetical protein DFS34DRAFT_653658 [Phlyctochytrium arcticum]|nr:hypothetical protein DFS34DRAFT_653658 [Phlyctochytrium arcticum]
MTFANQHFDVDFNEFLNLDEPLTGGVRNIPPCPTPVADEDCGDLVVPTSETLEKEEAYDSDSVWGIDPTILRDDPPLNTHDWTAEALAVNTVKTEEPGLASSDNGLLSSSDSSLWNQSTAKASSTKTKSGKASAPAVGNKRNPRKRRRNNDEQSKLDQKEEQDKYEKYSISHVGTSLEELRSFIDELERDESITPKEKRQIRNKISARNFRVRRKEYVTQLEEELRVMKAENTKLALRLSDVEKENRQLKTALETQRILTHNEPPVAQNRVALGRPVERTAQGLPVEVSTNILADRVRDSPTNKSITTEPSKDYRKQMGDEISAPATAPSFALQLLRTNSQEAVTQERRAQGCEDDSQPSPPGRIPWSAHRLQVHNAVVPEIYPAVQTPLIKGEFITAKDILTLSKFTSVSSLLNARRFNSGEFSAQQSAARLLKAAIASVKMGEIQASKKDYIAVRNILALAVITARAVNTTA